MECCKKNQYSCKRKLIHYVNNCKELKKNSKMLSYILLNLVQQSWCNLRYLLLKINICTALTKERTLQDMLHCLDIYGRRKEILYIETKVEPYYKRSRVGFRKHIRAALPTIMNTLVRYLSTLKISRLFVVSGSFFAVTNCIANTIYGNT